MAKQSKTTLFETGYGTWAEVILPLAIPIVYTYAVPPELASKLQRGFRVEVMFGGSKKYAGIIKRIHHNKPDYLTKPLLSVIDDDSLIFEQQLLLWEWISGYYMCSEGEVMAAAIPANFKLNSETILIYNDEYGDDFSELDADEFILAEALLIRKQLSATEVQLLLNDRQVYKVMKRLLDKKIGFAWEKLSERYKAKKDFFVTLHPRFADESQLEQLLNNWESSNKQMELLLSFMHFYKTEGEVKRKELLQKSGAGAAQLKALVDKEILIIEERKVDRIVQLEKNILLDFELSAAQEQCLSAVIDVFNHKEVCLLQGVTGSGKTLVYIKLIEAAIRKGEQVLYLLPEIALTAQIIRRLQKYFGGHVAIYHSKFNDQERVELWHRIRTGAVQVVLGARSAVFLPFQSLSLVIVDEEHDASFKQQEPAPRYHARDTAIYYASLFKAKVLLGTATPSIETFHNCKLGKYGKVMIEERYRGIELPAIEMINLRQVVQKGKVMLSPQLKAAIQQTLESGKQVILFQNRRGYNPYLICGTCGFLPHCIHCDVSLTLHKHSNKLHCHYCGSTYPRMLVCPQCGGNQWLEKNFGTEKIEEQLEADFPSYRIARMDVDSVKGKFAHDQLILQFEQQRLDILVGTQMVVKGLDFDHVGLVGIIDADGLLQFADFRVNERAFQLIEQVSGRAGRKQQRGKVMIQALNVQHPVLQFVLQHDYAGMFAYEMENRKAFFYPPYSRLISVVLKHKEKERVEAAAHKLATLLRSDLKEYVVGPAAPVVARLRNQYLMEILIKLPKETGMGLRYKKMIRAHFQLLQSEKQFKSIVIIADVDPV
jgi:primosomal protein N' (replication factor Y)